MVQVVPQRIKELDNVDTHYRVVVVGGQERYIAILGSSAAPTFHPSDPTPQRGPSLGPSSRSPLTPPNSVSL